LSTMSIPLVGGRPLSRHDAAAGFPAVLVNESAARQFWPDGGAIGKRLALSPIDSPGKWREVVGIVKDTSDLALDQAAKPALYVPMEQGFAPPQFLAVRTADISPRFAAALRRAVSEADPDQPILAINPMRQLVETSIGPRRFAMQVLMVFGFLSLALASIGLYGVVAYSVASRTQEIGVRVALGASGLSVFRLVFRQSMELTALGLLAGMAASLISARWISTLLYGVSAQDPFTALASGGLIVLISLAATYLPARQAARIQPIVALRQV